MPVWVWVVAPLAGAGGYLTYFIARYAFPLVPLAWVTDPEDVRRWFEVTVIEPSAVLPPDRRELEQ